MEVWYESPLNHFDIRYYCNYNKLSKTAVIKLCVHSINFAGATHNTDIQYMQRVLLTIDSWNHVIQKKKTSNNFYQLVFTPISSNEMDDISALI